MRHERAGVWSGGAGVDRRKETGDRRKETGERRPEKEERGKD
jgi:hypothetical protein